MIWTFILACVQNSTIFKFSYILLIVNESYTNLILYACWFLPFQSLASVSVCKLQDHLRFVWQFDFHNTKPRDMQPISIFHREIPKRHHLGTLQGPKMVLRHWKTGKVWWEFRMVHVGTILKAPMAWTTPWKTPWAPVGRFSVSIHAWYFIGRNSIIYSTNHYLTRLDRVGGIKSFSNKNHPMESCINVWSRWNKELTLPLPKQQRFQRQDG